MITFNFITFLKQSTLAIDSQFFLFLARYDVTTYHYLPTLHFWSEVTVPIASYVPMIVCNLPDIFTTDVTSRHYLSTFHDGSVFYRVDHLDNDLFPSIATIASHAMSST